MGAVGQIINQQNLAGAFGADSAQMESILSGRLRSFHRKAYYYLGNAADAEDAVQDALLSAYKHLDQFKGQAQLSSWLTAIVINSARMQLRRRPKQAHIPLDEPFGSQETFSLAEILPDKHMSPEEECRQAELTHQVKIAAKRLSPTLRETFKLRDLEGHSVREIAEILRVPEGTVKARLVRARARVKELMEKKLYRRRARITPETLVA